MSKVDELKEIAHRPAESAITGGLDERDLATLFFQEGVFSLLAMVGWGKILGSNNVSRGVG